MQHVKIKTERPGTSSSQYFLKTFQIFQILCGINSCDCFGVHSLVSLSGSDYTGFLKAK